MWGTTSSPWGTASFPPGQKSFWTSTTSKTSLSAIAVGMVAPAAVQVAGNRLRRRIRPP
jgi:hypothetical protein